MQLTYSGLVALSVAAFLVLPEGNRKSGFDARIPANADARVVEIRFAIGRFFVQVKAGRMSSASESAPELISASDIRSEPVVAVPVRRVPVPDSGRSPGAAMLTRGRVQPRPDRYTSRITEGLADNQGGVS